MRIGLYGGTFNPVHLAHLIIAEYVREQLDLGLVIFMPGALPPHKTGQPILPSNHRLAMLELATRRNPHFSVSDLELIRGGISYTVDTLRQLHELYHVERSELFMIVGADNAREIQNWRDPETINKICRLVLADRPGYPLDSLPAYIADLVVSDCPLMEISASVIRQRVLENKSIRYLVCSEVEDYILEHGLYRDKKSA